MGTEWLLVNSLPAETRMLHAQVKGLSIAYQRTGRGPAMVLLHGFALDSRSWWPQLEGLSDRFTVIAWDAPGAGQSEDPHEQFSMRDWADTLAGVLDANSIQRAQVIGLSWGGLLAQEFYRYYPSRVISLVLADTYAGWKGSLPSPIPEQRLEAAIQDSSLDPGQFVEKYLPGMFSDSVLPAVRKELGAIMAGFHPTGFRLMATKLAEADTRELLPTISVPTLLIWGDVDQRAPLGVGRAIRDAIPGARLEIISGAGHLSNLERPSVFNTLVREFSLPLESL